MTVPSVAVVVPVYNGADYVAETLQSLLAQDYERLEVVVIDDGSTDATPQIVRSFPVRCIRQDNAGPAAARNAGIAATDSELVTFCDSDDRYLPEKVRRQVAAFEGRPDVGCVLVRHRVLLAPGVEWPTWLRDDTGADPGSMMVRRVVVDTVGPLNPDLRFAEGFEWQERMRQAGIGIDVVPDVLVERRIHGANLSYDRRSLQLAMLRTMRGRISGKKASSDG